MRPDAAAKIGKLWEGVSVRPDSTGSALPLFATNADTLNLLALFESMNPGTGLWLTNSLNFSSPLERQFLIVKPGRTRLRRLRILPALEERTNASDLESLSYEHCGWDANEGKDVRLPIESIDTRKTPDESKPSVIVLLMYNVVGGVERNTIEVMRRLRDNYSFTVVTLSPLEASKGSLHHQFMEVADHYFEVGELFDEKHYLKVLEVLKRHLNPKILWLCNGSRWWTLNSLSLRWLFSGTRIIDQQVYDTEAGWIWSFDFLGTRLTDIFIAVNSRIAKHFQQHFKIAKNKIKLIYPAFRGDRFSPFSDEDVARMREARSLSRSDLTVAFAGRMTDQKRPLLFLEFARLLTDRLKSVQFVMIGQGEMDIEVDETIQRLNLTNLKRIRQTDEINEWLGLCDALAIVSKFEGLPIVSIESASLGVPIFTTDVGDMDFLISLTEAGCIEPVAGTAQTLADAFVTKFLPRLSEFRKLARANTARVRAEFDIKTISQSYETLFEEALHP